MLIMNALTMNGSSHLVKREHNFDEGKNTSIFKEICCFGIQYGRGHIIKKENNEKETLNTEST